MERLEALQAELPSSASDELLAAGRTLTDLDTEISTACGLCPGALTSTPDFVLSSAPTDLLTGLDSDELTLEAAPVSGQDVTGITIPEALQSPEALLPEPSLSPTAPVRTPQVVVPETTEARPDQARPDHSGRPTATEDVTDVVTDTTGDLADQLDGVTGGALGGLTGTVDNATGGLIGEVTGTVDGAHRRRARQRDRRPAALIPTRGSALLS